MMKIGRLVSFSLLALCFGLLLAAGLAFLVGDSGFQMIQVLFLGAFGSATQFGYSLFYATPLIFTGLSVALAFRAGLFNVGAEGQMAMGGLAMTWVALKFSYLPPLAVWTLSSLAAFCVAGFWGALAGWMKAYRGAHEVLATILLNYLAFGIVSFMIAFPMRNVESQAPETASIGQQFSSWPEIAGQSPLNAGFLVAITSALLLSWVLRKTIFGFRLRMVGESPGTALFNGGSVKRYTVLGMFLSGGVAGLAGLSDLFGYSLKLREGFTAGAGFVGIAVALLGRGSALGIIISALLFGALQKGALALDLEMEKVTRDLAVVIQAIIIFAVACEKGITEWWDRSLAARRSGE